MNLEDAVKNVPTPGIRIRAPGGFGKKEKDLSIETLRGIAILLVVSGYVIRGEIINGNQASFMASLLKFFYYLSSYLRIPLFTAISGYLYAASPATSSTMKGLYLGKARRLLIPFFVISTLQYVVFALFSPSSHQIGLSDIARIYLFPHHQFWFIYAAFLIFLVVGALDAFKALNTPVKWASCLFISLALNARFDFMGSNVLSIPGMNYLLPYFLLGYGLRRYHAFFSSISMVRVFGTLFIACFGTQQLLHFSHTSLDFHGHRILGALVAFSGIPLLFYFRRPISIFAWLGGYAFCIHLFYFFGFGISHLLLHESVKNTSALFFIYLAASIIPPIFVQQLLEKTSVTRRLVLGQRI